jgi:hypothetical protein
MRLPKNPLLTATMGEQRLAFHVHYATLAAAWRDAGDLDAARSMAQWARNWLQRYYNERGARC